MNKDNIQNNTNFKSPLRGDSGGLIVIADDITGAAEIGGVCLRYGLSVSFDINLLPEKKTDVRVIVTDSRSIDEESAYHTHRKLAEEIEKEHSTDFIFKKCDSVLRGYVLTELSALSEVFRKTSILLQPANPSTGRCIRNGIYYIYNEIIEKTGFSTDPDFPANTSLIQNLLQHRSTLKHHFTNIYTGKIKKIENTGVFAPDCDSVQQLQTSAALYEKSLLTCGSAAFFEQILIHSGFSEVNVQAQNPILKENFLMVAGSTHPESKKFRQKMVQSGCPAIALPPQLLQKHFHESDVESFVSELTKTYQKSRKLIIFINDSKVNTEVDVHQLKHRFSEIVKKLLENISVNEIFIEGGATAYDIFKTMDLTRFSPLNELAPGVLRLTSEQLQNVYFTLKPGSYLWPGGLFMQSD